MIKRIFICGTLSTLGTVMIIIAVVLQAEVSSSNKKLVIEEDNTNVVDMSSSNRAVEAKVVSDESAKGNEQVKEVSMEQAPQAEYIPPRIEVYEGMTLEELSQKLDRSLSGYLAGKGSVIASKSIELGVDPYIATAIMLHETGCRSRCSNLVIKCNNVGGQKGYPGCGGGSYKYYATLDEGINGHIANLHKNYFSRGLTTVESIGRRYAESSTWASKINGYVNYVRAN